MSGAKQDAETGLITWNPETEPDSQIYKQFKTDW